MRIKKMREEKGLTQEQLAEKISEDVQFVRYLESGKIKLENISFLTGIRLIKAIAPDEQAEQDARNTYVMLKIMLGYFDK